MTIGIGTDIIEINRIEKAIASRGFLRKAFTAREMESLRGRPPQAFAGVFAAKEAVAKALGAGFSSFGLTDIEILKDGLGKPFAALHGGAGAAASALGVTNIHVSISHCKLFATACALAEGGCETSAVSKGGFHESHIEAANG